MSAEGRVLNATERRAWLTATGQRRTAAHRLKGRVCHWVYCDRCGLVCLKNDVSRRAVAAPCVWEE